MLGDRAERTSIKALREQLESGRAVEIAGYTLSPSLALPLDSAELDLPRGYAGRVLWCEVSAGQTDTELSPSAATCIGRWRERGLSVEPRVVTGLPFWKTQEIAECPAIERASRAFLTEEVCS